jgi:NLR family CARD domain-containing protein 3
MRSLTSLNASLAAHVSSSSLSTTSANEENLSTVPLIRSLSPVVQHVLGQGASRGSRAISHMTFGEKEWNRYYGEVGEAPALPGNIEATLDASCPFWPGKKVRDTHLLVLIPAKVNGQLFSLNLLRELIQHPNNGGHKTKYCYYDNGSLQAQFGAVAPAASYWLLMTRDVLPRSRNKNYVDQKQLMADHARCTGLNYEVPKALDAATAILTHHVRNGEQLYSKRNDSWTFTRCEELIRSRFGEYPAVVGGFASSGLDVRNDYFDNDLSGVAGCRKFF